MNKHQVYETSMQIIENLPDNLSSKNTIKLFLTAACSTKDGIDKNGNPIFWNPPNYISFDWIERNYKEFQTQKRIEKTQEQTEKFKEKIKPFLYDENGTQFNRKYYRKFIKALFTVMRGTDTDYIDSNVKKIIGHINYIKGRSQEESALFAYSIGRGPGKSEIIYAYAKALERLGAGIKSSSIRDFCSKDGWTTEAPATYDLIYSLNELEDSEVDWNQEENYVKHGTYAIKQKFEKPIDTESKCHLAIATNSRSGQGNRWNTYIKFSDRFQWSKTNSKLDREKLINAWVDVITYCPRTICSLQELNEMPFQTTGPQSTILYRWLEKQAGCEVNYASFLQKCRRDGKYTKNAEANWRKELELIENKGLIDIDWSSNSLEIIIRVNSDLDELYGGDRQPRGKQYLYNGISKALKFYIFTLLHNKLIDFSNDSNKNSLIISKSCKNVKDDKFFGTPVHGYTGGGKKVNNTPTKYTEYETINRLKAGSETAANDKVERMDSFLFEIDPPDSLTAEEKQKDKEEQKAHSKELFEQGIVNRVVDSGNKSIHNRVTISDEPDNIEQYKWIAHRLNEKFFNNKADKNCFNPARLTRMPNAIRSDNGKRQELLYLSNNVLNYEWREEYNRDKQLEEYIRERNAEKYKNSNDYIPRETILKWNTRPEVKKLLENSFSDGERHEGIPTAVNYLKNICHWSQPETESLVKATGIKDWQSFTKWFYKHTA